MTRRALRASLLVLGLGLAACGTQADAGAESAVAIPPTTAVDSVPGLSTNSESASADPDTRLAEESNEADGDESKAVGESTAELSPLSTQVVELPSALPERVLAGLGDPVGVPPQTISLPDLGVDNAAITPVGLEANGELEVPGADEVGWYQFGVGVDGGKGSTVLAAHIAYNGRDGVFRNLADSQVGEEITVTTSGEPVVYRVESVIPYNKQELPISDLFAEDGAERLVLITCGGSFNPNVRSYEDNLVVVAVPV